MNLLRTLAQSGLRVFSLEDAFKLLQENGLSETYSKKVLHLMGKRGDLQVLGNGLYALPTELLSGGPLHAFEIGMKIVKKGAISHRSAMFFYQMTDQILTEVYITAPRTEEANRSTRVNYFVDNTRFHIKRVDNKHFFGVKRVFIEEAPVWITDIEKTLLDGLVDPSLCGGFREVMHAFEQSYDKINPDKFMEYINRMPVVIAKRAGWLFEKMQCFEDLQERLVIIHNKTIQKLNPKGIRKGSLNKRWTLMENI
jgi:predicted transcriptional regulator of viral defense system